MISLKNGQSCYSIHYQDRAFLYGDGFFTTIKLQGGQPQLWQRHIKRLTKCAEQLSMELDIAIVEQQVRQLLDSHSAANGVLKIIISRGTGTRGYLPPAQHADIYLQFFEQPLSTDHAETIAIDSGILQLTLGQVMPALAGLKTLNRLEQVLLRQELAGTSWPEALVTDIQGNIIEGVYSNCFMVVNQAWHTPALDQAGIAGVMRAEILALMQAQDIPCTVANIPELAIDQIEALFFCNALTGMVPVKSLLGRPLDLEPVRQLMTRLQL